MHSGILRSILWPPSPMSVLCIAPIGCNESPLNPISEKPDASRTGRYGENDRRPPFKAFSVGCSLLVIQATSVAPPCACSVPPDASASGPPCLATQMRFCPNMGLVMSRSCARTVDPGTFGVFRASCREPYARLQRGVAAEQQIEEASADEHARAQNNREAQN